MDRDSFLDMVHDAAGAGRLPSAPDAEPGDTAVEDMVATFADRLAAVDGVVHQPQRREEIAPLVVDIALSSGANRFVAWDRAQLPVPEVLDAVLAAGLTAVDGEVPADADARSTKLAELGGADVGITGALAGFAVSGSIVLTAGPGRPRLASLLPDVHIALLPISALTSQASTWLAANGAEAAATANLVFITGPSRTGDIEMKLNLGVHGPRTIHVVLVPGED